MIWIWSIAVVTMVFYAITGPIMILQGIDRRRLEKARRQRWEDEERAMAPLIEANKKRRAKLRRLEVRRDRFSSAGLED